MKRHRRLFIWLGLFLLLAVIVISIIVFLLSRSSSKSTATTISSGGVLSLNFNPSAPVIGRPVDFLITSLDSQGKALCDSRLVLTINGSAQPLVLTSAPQPEPTTAETPLTGTISTIATAASDFRPSPPPPPGIPATQSCPSPTATDPTHTAQFKPSQAGSYTAELKNLDTNTTVSASFTVPDPAQSVSDRDLPLTVTRNPLTRPLTGQRYPMVITVTALKDYSGDLADTLPAGFDLAWYGSAQVKESGSQTLISWPLNLKANEVTELKYEYIYSDAAKPLPQVTIFGPLAAKSQNLPNAVWNLVIAK